ncbi:MAG TPA: thioredoxin domain-containing protein [Phenylobacterium sp.]|uniref:thioredoxin domain-containing protein n=1 Tax=Phenylobacterium sp. TaxID=1871053 RepID=UPI002B469228|nr:thioredoxin domain-containing protein [Phenylobacterium sp.]HKR89299.1 thioredoxin domain-containing protein [Phenylobacterium sp.]
MLSRRLLIAAVAVAGLSLAGCNKGGKGAAGEGDMSLGPADAKVQVVEYASASCSHCARFNNTVFPEFKAKYIDTGKVHYTLKEFLTPPEEVAAAGFLMARCAGKDKYFTVLDAIYKNQAEMFQTQDYRGVLLRIAQSAGMTEDQFNKCVSDPEALKALNARVQRAIKDDKISGTPTFVVNGKQIATGEVSLAQLDAAIAAASK